MKTREIIIHEFDGCIVYPWDDVMNVTLAFMFCLGIYVLVRLINMRK